MNVLENNTTDDNLEQALVKLLPTACHQEDMHCTREEPDNTYRLVLPSDHFDEMMACMREAGWTCWVVGNSVFFRVPAEKPDAWEASYEQALIEHKRTHIDECRVDDPCLDNSGACPRCVTFPGC